MGKLIDDLPLPDRRALAVKLLLKGVGISEVSRVAQLSLPTVSKYKNLVERGGPEALAHLRIHGGVPRLDNASESWLVSAIKHSPGLYGYPGPTWTISQLREVIFQRLGIQFSSSHVGYLVRSYGLAYRLGYSPSSKAPPNTAQKSQGGVYAARRAVAARMLLDGNSVEIVARTLAIGVPTVRKYRSMVSAGGIDAVEKLRSSGRKATLSAADLDWLRGKLEANPTAQGFETELWRSGDVQKLIKEKFGIYHSHGHVRRIVGKLGLEHRMRPPKQRTEKKRLTIDDEVLAWVAATLKELPRAHGIDADNWTNARLRTVIRQRVGVDYTRGYILKIAIRAGVADLLTRRRS
ncbi:Transposase [Burkholderia sp. WP9]|uniref:helix-turn-helix domain-containing protein n=1 Tax=Burkholderia sp. WP9 TaxID=1500263 RepID=UPI00089A8F82|nr:helix-turn-helix domain-containing protein [Burkholderia sp. WP9]SEF13345.1 Transposase [Burkholderia sp. WP9]